MKIKKNYNLPKFILNFFFHENNSENVRKNSTTIKISPKDDPGSSAGVSTGLGLGRVVACEISLSSKNCNGKVCFYNI